MSTLVLWAPAAVAQTGNDVKALKKEIDALKAGQAAIQKELDELKSLLRDRLGPAEELLGDLVIDIQGAPAKGSQTARAILVEFSDYQCPFCARHVRDTFPQIENDYVKTGKLRYVFRNFPIASLHPQAFKAHEAASCADDQRKYWEMHARLFANQKAFAPTELASHAEAIGLDLARFQECLGSSRHAGRVRADIAEAQKAGIRGTPTFLLGVSEGGATRVRIRRVVSGAQPYAAFKDAIDSLLGAPTTAKP